MIFNGLFLAVLLSLHCSSAQPQYGLCSQVYQMHEYCINQQQHVAAPNDHATHLRIGKAGPRGPPGKTPEIDYVKINATIKEFCRAHSDILNEIEKNKIETSDAILQLQKDMQHAMQKITFLNSTFTGWYKASNGLFYKVFQTKTDYATAISMCKEVGARLATEGLRNSEVRREIITLGQSNTNNIWIGMDDKAKEGTFVWIDGVQANAGNTDWSGGQPDNARGVEHCAHIHVGYNWKMNDAECSRPMKFVCEKTLETP